MSDSVIPRTVAYQAPPSMGFSRQEYWSALSLPSSLHIFSSVQSLSSVHSLRPHELKPTRFLHLWDFPGKNTGVGCHFLLQTNLDSILKSRDITLPTKVWLVKAMIFSVVMHGCESWAVKKAECQRIDAFELWCWRRLLRVPWTARISRNQSWISIGRTDAEAETPTR